MSEIQQCKCDCCGKRVDDRLREHGWLYFNYQSSSCEVVFVLQRTAEGKAVTATLDVRRVDFCSLACLSQYLEAAFEQAKAKEAAKRLGANAAPVQPPEAEPPF